MVLFFRLIFFVIALAIFTEVLADCYSDNTDPTTETIIKKNSYTDKKAGKKGRNR